MGNASTGYLFRPLVANGVNEATAAATLEDVDGFLGIFGSGQGVIVRSVSLTD
jgi:hypothetical protein